MSTDPMRRVDASVRELRTGWLAMTRALRVAGLVAAVLCITALVFALAVAL